MNRRGFLKLFGAGIGAAVALANVPALLAQDKPTQLFSGPISFRGIPIVFDPACANNRIYFVSSRAFAIRYDRGTWKGFA